MTAQTNLRRRVHPVWQVAACLALGACTPLSPSAQAQLQSPSDAASQPSPGAPALFVMCNLVASRQADEQLPAALERIAGLRVTRWRALQPRLLEVEFACPSAAQCDEGLHRLQNERSLFESVSREGRKQVPRLPSSPQVRP